MACLFRKNNTNSSSRGAKVLMDVEDYFAMSGDRVDVEMVDFLASFCSPVVDNDNEDELTKRRKISPQVLLHFPFNSFFTFRFFQTADVFGTQDDKILNLDLTSTASGSEDKSQTHSLEQVFCATENGLFGFLILDISGCFDEWHNE
jgi:hypothetical protein